MGQQARGLIDGTAEQPCSGISIHGASEKGNDAWTSSKDLSAIGTCSQHVVKMELDHSNAVDEICSKTNVGDKNEAAMASGEQDVAWTSKGYLSAVRTRSQRVDSLELRHSDAVDERRSRPNTGDEDESAMASGEQHDAQTSSRDPSAARTRFQRVNKPELCHSNTVNEIRSKANVETESETAVSFLGQQEQIGYHYPSVRLTKPPDKQGQRVHDEQSAKVHSAPRPMNGDALDNQSRRGTEGQTQLRRINGHTARATMRKCIASSNMSGLECLKACNPCSRSWACTYIMVMMDFHH
jgi:hypothetical protein